MRYVLSGEIPKILAGKLVPLTHGGHDPPQRGEESHVFKDCIPDSHRAKFFQIPPKPDPHPPQSLFSQNGSPA